MMAHGNLQASDNNTLAGIRCFAMLARFSETFQVELHALGLIAVNVRI